MIACFIFCKDELSKLNTIPQPKSENWGRGVALKEGGYYTIGKMQVQKRLIGGVNVQIRGGVDGGRDEEMDEG